MGREFMSGLMAAGIRENGRTITCMAEEFTLGKMDVSTKGST